MCTLYVIVCVCQSVGWLYQFSEWDLTLSSVLPCKVARTLEEFDVEERPSSVLEEKFPNLTIIHSAVKALHTRLHVSSCLTACRMQM